MFLNWVPLSIENCLHGEQETNFEALEEKAGKNLTLTKPTRDVENKNRPF